VRQAVVCHEVVGVAYKVFTSVPAGKSIPEIERLGVNVGLKCSLTRRPYDARTNECNAAESGKHTKNTKASDISK
jgi:hypothetical protein